MDSKQGNEEKPNKYFLTCHSGLIIDALIVVKNITEQPPINQINFVLLMNRMSCVCVRCYVTEKKNCRVIHLPINSGNPVEDEFVVFIQLGKIKAFRFFSNNVLNVEFS